MGERQIRHISLKGYLLPWSVYLGLGHVDCKRRSMETPVDTVVSPGDILAGRSGEFRRRRPVGTLGGQPLMSCMIPS